MNLESRPQDLALCRVDAFTKRTLFMRMLNLCYYYLYLLQAIVRFLIENILAYLLTFIIASCVHLSLDVCLAPIL